MTADKVPNQPEWVKESLRENPWLRGLAGRIATDTRKESRTVQADPLPEAYGDSDSRQNERDLTTKTGKPIETVALGSGDLL